MEEMVEDSEVEVEVEVEEILEVLEIVKAEDVMVVFIEGGGRDVGVVGGGETGDGGGVGRTCVTGFRR